MLAIGSLAVVAGLTYVRLYFGVDFTDESFYIAVPYRFVLGARPLIDETSLVQQTSGLLLYPFVKLWDSLFGLDGIILYARHLHFLFSIAVALALFVSLRRILADRYVSAVLAGAAIAFVPFGIHGLSYNTFATGFFTVGCFLGAAWLWGTRRTLFAAGIAHGLAIFAYPPLVLAVGCFLVGLCVASRPRSVRKVGPALAPIAAAGLATVVFFAHRGLETTRELIEQRSKFVDQGGGLSEVRDLASFVSTSFTHKYVALALLAVALLLLRWRPAAAVAPLLLSPLAALPSDLRTSAAATEFVTNFSLLAPALVLFIPGEILGRRLLTVVWLPAAIGGLTTALNSTNGGVNLAIGLFPGAVVAAIFLALAVRRAAAAGRLEPVEALAALGPAIVFVGIGVVLQYLTVYRDAGLSRLTSRVDHGAFAHIYTTESKRDFITTLDRDLAAVSSPSCRIVYYKSFPAGYLLDHGQPETNATWLIDVADKHKRGYQQLLIDYYKKRGTLPDIVVRLDRLPLSNVKAVHQHYGAGEPLERLFQESRYVTVLAGGDYTIRGLRSTTCAGRAPG